MVRVREPDFDETKFGISEDRTATILSGLDLSSDSDFGGYLRECVPHKDTGWGYVDWLGYQELIRWNKESSDAIMFFRELGFVTFAHTSGPDFYCYDTIFGRILSVGHHLTDFSTFRYWENDGYIDLPHNRWTAYALASQVWPNFGDFLEWLEAMIFRADSMDND